MIDPYLYTTATAQALKNSTNFRTLVDYAIPNFQDSDAEKYLSGPKKTLVGVRLLNLNTKLLGGSKYSGYSDNEELIEFHIIQKANTDSGIGPIIKIINTILAGGATAEIGNILYQLNITGKIKFRPLESGFSDRQEATGTCILRIVG